MRIGIIDLGTNTFNLLIAEVSHNTYTTIFKTKIPVKLGQGGIDKNVICEDAFQRGIAALETHKVTLSSYKVDKYYAYATSGIRSTNNGQEFVKTAKEKLGIDINVISGEEEAELVYKGVKQAIPLPNEEVLIIDIGGGSTEFIIADNEKLLWKHSFKLGVSRIKEIFKPSDPILEEEIIKLNTFLEQELTPLFTALKQYPCKVLIGSSGSFDSFAEMIAHKQGKLNLLENKTSYHFKIQDILDINKTLIASSYKERLNIPGLIEMRADMIVLAGLFIEFIIKKIEAKQVCLSQYALKEGAIQDIINQ